MSRRRRVSVSFGFVLLASWFAACSGVRAAMLTLTAAAIHEAGHLLALCLCRAPVRSFRLGVFGAVIEADIHSLTYPQEAFIILAGPIANLLAAAILVKLNYLTAAGAHGVLCAFNLLPIFPLDGARALDLFLCALSPASGEKWSRAVSALTAAALAFLLIFIMARSGGNLWLIPASAGAIGAALRDLYPNGNDFLQKFVK